MGRSRRTKLVLRQPQLIAHNDYRRSRLGNRDENNRADEPLQKTSSRVRWVKLFVTVREAMPNFSKPTHCLKKKKKRYVYLTRRARNGVVCPLS